MENLKVRIVDLFYNLTLKNRVSVITGDSATGKTTLVNCIYDLSRRTNINSPFISNLTLGNDFIETTIKLVLTYNLRFMQEVLEQNPNDKILFLIDEDFNGLNSMNLVTFVNKNNNIYVLIISRELDNKNLIFGVEDIYELTTKKVKGVYNVSNTPYVREQYFIENSAITDDALVYTEDSCEGYLAFRLFIKDYIKVSPLSGKDRVIHTITKNNESKDNPVVLIVAMCSYGNNYLNERLKLEQEGYSLIHFISNKSFEYFMLQALTKFKYKPDYLNYIKSNDMISEEQYYEKELYDLIYSKYNVKYIKGTLPSMVCSKTIGVAIPTFYNQLPVKWIKLYKDVIREFNHLAEINNLFSVLFQALLDGTIKFNGLIKNTNDTLNYILLDLMLGLYIDNIKKYKTTRMLKLYNEDLELYNIFIGLLSENSIIYTEFMDKKGIKLGYFKFKEE